MNAQQFQHLRALFHRACDLPTGDQPAFVREACGDDGEVRAQLEKLLGLDAASSHPLVDSAAPLGGRLLAGAAHAAVPPPAQVGRYRILRPIGEGGMGAVFLAEQDNPRRAVALKMLRPGLYSADLLRRFQHEAHILGRLQHPGIAQVFEAGAAELPGGASQPFFAMEFIDGQPLTEFARSQRLSVAERLELIARTCDAVQHAHQRGVIHRDLKPANILVVEEGAKGHRGQGSEGRNDTAASPSTPRTLGPSTPAPPQPKVLDFGVARVIDDDAQRTMHTATGQIVGTLAYMSPEQLAGDPLAVDTRTDVYALGVVLYELLAGRLPFVTEGRSIHEVIDAIRAQEPPRLAALQPVLAGDVETIVHKALEKDPTRRYASAAELAADLRRFLRDEPIAARPPTLLYQLRKFARRNTALVTGVGLALAALVLGTIGTSWQAWRATQERQRAEAALVDAQRARGVAEATTEFLNHDVLGASSLDAPGPSRDLRISDIVARVEERVAAGALSDKPEVEASIRNTLGFMNRQIGRLEEAENHHRTALEKHRQLYGDDHATVAVTLGNLGELVAERGRPDEAEPMLRQALEMSRRLIGPTARETGVAAMNLSGLLAERRDDAAAAEALLGEALPIFQSVGAGAELVLALNNLANLKRDARDLDGAEALYRRALERARRDLGDEHLTVALLLNNLGLTLKFRRDFDGAEPLYREALDIRRKRLPPGHQALGESLNNLAALLRDKTDFAGAEPLFREALTIAEQTFPAGSWQIEVTRRSVGTCELKLGRFAEAEKTLKTAYKRLALLPEPLADHARRTAALLAELYEKWGGAEGATDRASEVARWKERAAPPAP